MNAFDVESFVAEMDRMGVKLTAVPLADGTVRVNRWRTMQAVEHGHRIDHLWGMQVGHVQRFELDSLDELDSLFAQLSADQDLFVSGG